ncbi:hypothetical protein [Paenibacillus oryzisoli]|uniref:Uncharacterized protein n=1 Tax=Paenibacillus oryzisoli TaxID=1850517 RepID=A0A198AM24_9BACL|nr:hypothetical protein [Paenibacillus oryzisoli]OAS22066.1 hypothetical protein A8708_33365 [Paenibacillus oryzisoli]
MTHTAEIKRVQTLLRHAQQQTGASNQADERIKSLSSRLEVLQQLAGVPGDSSETVSDSVAADVSEEASEENEVSEAVNEEVVEETNNEANDEVAASEEQPAPDPQNE